MTAFSFFGEPLNLFRLRTWNECVGVCLCTYTLSTSISWLCVSLPPVFRFSLRSLIWSAKAGLRSNSTGNSEIQYLHRKRQKSKCKRADLTYNGDYELDTGLFLLYKVAYFSSDLISAALLWPVYLLRV